MKTFARTAWMPLALGLLTICGVAGCPDIDEDAFEDLERIEIRLGGVINALQASDPRNVTLPPPLIAGGNTVIINNNVTVINNIREDIIVADIPDVTILGFENLTFDDAYYTYLVEGEFQGVFVFSGETLLLEYPCLADVELLTEDYFDPVTGVQIDGFDITDAFYEEGFDYFCGEAVIFSFDPDGIAVGFEPVDLLN